MAAIPYTIINKGETVIITLNFTFSTPVGVELHADFSSIKSGESTDFTGTVYSITGLHLDPLETTTFSVDYTALSGVPGVVNGSIDIEGLSRFGDSDKLVGTIITLIAPPPIDITNISVAPTTGTYTINLESSDGPPRTGPPPPPPIAPVADFVGSPLSGLAPLTVNFTDLSTNNPTEWYWNLGNGTTSVQNPSTTYDSYTSQTFNVSLSVYNEAGGDSEIKNAYISVDAWPQQLVYSLVQVGATSTTQGAAFLGYIYGTYTGDYYNYNVVGFDVCPLPYWDEIPYVITMEFFYSGTISYQLATPIASNFELVGTSENIIAKQGDPTVLAMCQKYKDFNSLNDGWTGSFTVNGSEFASYPYNKITTGNFTLSRTTCPAGNAPPYGDYAARNRWILDGSYTYETVDVETYLSRLDTPPPSTITVRHISSGSTKTYQRGTTPGSLTYTPVP